jgi:hypothetical protein
MLTRDQVSARLPGNRESGIRNRLERHALRAIPHSRCRLIDVKRAHRFAEGDAPDGLGEQLGHRQLPDLAAGSGLLAERNGVGDHQHVELRIFQVADRRARQHRMGAVGNDLVGAVFLQRRCRCAQGAGGVHDVVDQHAILAGDVTDDVHDGGHVRLWPPLVDDRELGIVETLGHRTGTHHATDVGADHDQLVATDRAPDVGEQDRRRVHIVDRDVEEPLDLLGVHIHRQHPVGAYCAEHAGGHLGGDRYPRRARSAVLPGIAEIGHHGRHAGHRCPLQRVDQHQQFHEVFGGGRTGRLDYEHFLPPHVLLDLDVHFAIGKLPDQRLAEPGAENLAHLQSQRAVGVS